MTVTIIEIGLFFLVLAAAASIVWTSVRVGISPMPSGKQAQDLIVKLVDPLPAGPVYELGSGWGQLAVALAKQFPDRRVVGYELSPLPWLVSLALKRFFKLENLSFVRADFLQADMADATVLVSYLHREAMEKLAVKLRHEAGNERYLVSHNFALPGVEAEQKILLSDFYRSPVYLYRV